MELFDHLKFLGFKEDKFLSDLKLRIVLGLPDFQLWYSTEIDNHNMSFRLYFQRTGIDGDYCLQKYDAIMWRDIDLVHGNIGGVSTSALEERMRSIDWGRVPDARFPEDIATIERIRGICDDLQVIQSQSVYGWAVSQQLRLKYWSGTLFDSADLEYLRKQQQQLKTFNGILPDIKQCYHIHFRLWDIRNPLLEGLADLGFNLEVMVDRNLMFNYPNDFHLEFFRRQDEGIVCYDIPVIWNEGQSAYSIGDYSASLFSYPPIIHGHYSGVDTAELEASMEAIDWEDDTGHYIDVDGEPRFTPEIEEIVSLLLYKLSEDPEGSIVSAALQGKFWAGSPDFSGIMEDIAWRFLDDPEAKSATFYANIHATEAYNLLCGRAISLSRNAEEPWLILDFNQVGESGHPLITLESYNRDELVGLLKDLPLATGKIKQVCDGLIHGDIVAVELLTGQSINIIADVQHRALNFFSTDMAPVTADSLYTSTQFKRREEQVPGKPDEGPSSKSTSQDKTKKRKGKGLNP